MGYILRSGVSCCQAGGFTFFLDRDRDRYFAIGGKTHDAFADLVQDKPSKSECHIAGLIGDGLLVRTPGDDRPLLCERTIRAERSALDLADALSRRPSMARALLAILAARISLRWFGLAWTLNRLEARKRRARPRPNTIDEVSRIAAAFDRCNSIVSPLDQCLPRSIAVAHRYLDLGLDPSFFMGVRPQPFGAHAWVESGGLIANDRFDTVHPYTPILVL